MLVFFTKSSFILFTVRCFFLLLAHFLAVEDYELAKSTILVSVPLTPEWSEFYLDPSLFSSILTFSLMMFCVRLLPELMILLSTHTHPARNIPGIFSAMLWVFRKHLGNILKENI